MSCSDSPISCSARIHSRSATSPIPGWKAASTRPSRITSGGVTYQPNQVYSFTARGRFDEATFTPQRLEVESRANFDRWTLQAAVRRLCAAAPARPADATRRHPRRRIGQGDGELDRARLGPLRHRQRSIRPDRGSALAISTTASCCRVNWLTGYTYTADAVSSGQEQHGHAAIELADDRPRCLGAGRRCVLNFAVTL